MHLPFLSQSLYRVGSGLAPPLVGPFHSMPAGPIMNISSSSSSSSSGVVVPQFSLAIFGSLGWAVTALAIDLSMTTSGNFAVPAVDARDLLCVFVVELITLRNTFLVVFCHVLIIMSVTLFKSLTGIDVL